MKILVLTLMIAVLSSCSLKTTTIASMSALGGAMGAALGYEAIHRGAHNEYQTQNTIISASVGAAIFGLATWYHLKSLDDQKIELAGKFSRATYLDRDSNPRDPLEGLTAITLGKQSIKLDKETRWVLPEFQKRFLPPERSESELIAPNHSWEIVRPGFFLTRDQDPHLFKLEGKK